MCWDHCSPLMGPLTSWWMGVRDHFSPPLGPSVNGPFVTFWGAGQHQSPTAQRPATVCAPGSNSMKSLETVATRVVTGTSHWTILFCENCWLASASGLGCGPGVELGGTLTTCDRGVRTERQEWVQCDSADDLTEDTFVRLAGDT